MSLLSGDRGNTKVRIGPRLKRLADLRVAEMSRDEEGRTLVLSGELDLASSWLLDCPLRRIGANGTRSFTLDLSGVTFIDSAGIRAVLAARGLCAARGCEFMLVPGPAQVQRVFEMSGLIDHLPFRNHGTGIAGDLKSSGDGPPEKQPSAGSRR